MNLLVVGAGAMGRWFARALRSDASTPIDVSVTDADAETAAMAAASLDATVLTPEEASHPDTHFDLVCLAVPIPAATDAIAQYSPATSTAICDLTGTMTGPVTALREHAANCERLSLHPLFAPENEPGSVAVVVEDGGPITATVRAALTRRGNDVFETTPAEHDRAMETVQASAHTAILAYALAAEPVDDRFHTPISGPLAALAEQVTAGDPRVYADIQSAFDGAEDVAAAAQEIAAADEATFADLYEAAGR